MDKLNSTQEIIDKIEEICLDFNPSILFDYRDQRLNNGKFYEIRMTRDGSIFLEKNVENYIDIERALINRKESIFRQEDKSALEQFPNIYIYENHKVMSNIPQKTEEQVNFIVQKPKTALDRVILPPNVKKEVETALSLIKFQTKIYEEWGFSEVDSKPKLILNFYGPPGTGKTMVSHAIAHQLNKNILAVNYAEIESKYVGDAPKNLFKAFELATKEKAVLFFDEADSFLGKRIENVQSSSDQAINSLRSQMLILLEDFDGVVIFATNLAKNYDRAFESRILKHIHFDLPDLEGRKKIISITIPSKAPFALDVNKEELCNKLAEIAEGFSGREIKNAVLESLTLGAQSLEEVLSEEFFIKGFENTKEKIKKLEEERKANAMNPIFKQKIEEKIKQNLEQKERDDDSKTLEEKQSILQHPE